MASRRRGCCSSPEVVPGHASRPRSTAGRTHDRVVPGPRDPAAVTAPTGHNAAADVARRPRHLLSDRRAQVGRARSAIFSNRPSDNPEVKPRRSKACTTRHGTTSASASAFPSIHTRHLVTYTLPYFASPRASRNSPVHNRRRLRRCRTRTSSATQTPSRASRIPNPTHSTPSLRIAHCPRSRFVKPSSRGRMSCPGAAPDIADGPQPEATRQHLGPTRDETTLEERKKKKNDAHEIEYPDRERERHACVGRVLSVARMSATKKIQSSAVNTECARAGERRGDAPRSRRRGSRRARRRAGCLCAVVRAGVFGSGAGSRRGGEGGGRHVQACSRATWRASAVVGSRQRSGTTDDGRTARNNLLKPSCPTATRRRDDAEHGVGGTEHGIRTNNGTRTTAEHDPQSTIKHDPRITQHKPRNTNHIKKRKSATAQIPLA